MKRARRLVRGVGIVLVLVCVAAGCGRSKPPPGPVSFREIRFKKVVLWQQDGTLYGHFALENERGQELAMSGALTLEFYREANVNVQGEQGFQMKVALLKTTVRVEVKDFQWIYYHSFLTEDDFVCKFKVPLSEFQSLPKGGAFVHCRISFKPDVHEAVVEQERRVWLP